MQMINALVIRHSTHTQILSASYAISELSFKF